MEKSKISAISNAITGKKGRWMVLATWIVLTVLLTFLLPNVQNEVVNNNENLPAGAPTIEAEKLIKKEFPNSSGIPALLTWHRESGLTDKDLAQIQGLAQELTENPLPNQASVPPFHKIPLPALKGSLSEDGTTIVQPIFFEEKTETDALKEGLEEIQKIVIESNGENSFEAKIDSADKLSTRLTGPAGISVDATALFEDADVSLLIATVLLVLILLLLIYRSPIMAIIPLIAVGFAYGVTSPLLGFMAHEGWIAVDSQAISIMTVLLFGAGTDYCLFFISHYRDELRKEENKFTALVNAFKDSSGAIAMSGLTIVISLLALLLAKYGAYHRFAVPFSLSILIMGFSSLTLVPALLSIFGRGSFFPMIPRTPKMEEERAQKKGKPVKVHKQSGRVGRWIGNVVIHKPWTVTIICVVLFSSFGIYSTQVKYSYDLLSSFPEDMPSREGFSVISDAYSPGELAPVQVVVDTDGKTVDPVKNFSDIKVIGSVSEPVAGETNPDLMSYELKFNTNPYDMKAMETIPDIRDAAEAALKDAGISSPVSKVWIAGQTASQYDSMTTSDEDRKLIIPVIIVLISLLLLAYLRSITAMIYLMGTVILSYTAALGLGWLILHNFMGVDAIQGAIPLYAFVFLVALGEDYNIFMVSSIWRKKKSMPLKQAIKEGVMETSGVITSAGIILAATFAVLATLPIQVLVQFGIITSIGILMDTFIVRPFLVPAITTLFGRRAFWPSKAGIYKEKEKAKQ